MASTVGTSRRLSQSQRDLCPKLERLMKWVKPCFGVVFGLSSDTVTG
jgi:hypothetical protein